MNEKLINARLKKNLTRAEVAELVGITQKYYYMIEMGTRNPSLEIAKKIAKVLGIRNINIF